MNETDILEKLAKAVDTYNITPERVQKAIQFLYKYGYLIKTKSLTLQDVIEAVIAFQQFFGREATGLLDPKTLSLLEAPRCPVPDILRDENGNIQFASNYGWNTHSLTYCINGWIGDEFTKEEQRQVVRELADSVERNCDLKFTEVSSTNQANIVMGVGQGAADDFDGSNGVLGWMQLPTKNSRQVQGKLDTAEFWKKVGSRAQGIVARAVLAHEFFGHGLGLVHENNPADLMNPYYSPNIYDLTPRTIQRLVSMYGAPKTSPAPTPTPVPVPNPTPVPQPSNPGEKTLSITFTGDIKQIILPGYSVIRR